MTGTSYDKGYADGKAAMQARMDKAIVALEWRIKELEKLSDPFIPHSKPEDCPTWYDGCHCTVAALEHNIKRADDLQAHIDKLDSEISMRRKESTSKNRIMGDLQAKLDKAVEAIEEINGYLSVGFEPDKALCVIRIALKELKGEK
jgi:hypothetical protein